MLQTILVFSPALGALIAGLFGRLHRRPRRAARHLRPDGASPPLCAWINLFANVGEPAFKVRAAATGSSSAASTPSWALRVDSLSTIMMLVVGFISFLIHVYSVGYMSHDNSVPRFMAYLSLFTFAMLMLVTSDNLLQLFFGWEGVGVASYLLIGFWYDQALGLRRGDQGVHRQPRRRFRPGAGHRRALPGLRQHPVRRDLRRTCREFAETTLHAFGGDFAHARPDRRAAVHRRHGQVGAARPAHLAARRDGGPDPGLGADPCRDHGDRRRVPGRPLLAALRVSRRTRWRWSPSSAPRRRCSPPRSA